MKGLKKYRVRRLGPRRFRIMNPRGDYVENESGRPSEYASHANALTALRAYERGDRREYDPLIDELPEYGG